MPKSHIEKFMIDNFEPSVSEYIQKESIWEAYEQWSEDNAVPMMDKNIFFRQLYKQEYISVQKYKPSIEIEVDGKMVKDQIEVVKGIKWKGK